jgi:hypothetical protein
VGSGSQAKKGFIFLIVYIFQSRNHLGIIMEFVPRMWFL